MATATIGTTGTFTSIQAWEDSLPATLTEPEVGQLLNELFLLSSPVTFGGVTTSETNTITLECATGASFRDHADKGTNPIRINSAVGVLIRNTNESGSGNGLIIGAGLHMVLRGLQIEANGYNTLLASAADLTVDSCILRGQGPAVLDSYGCTAGRVMNTVVIQYSADRGAYNRHVIFDACTFVRPAATAATSNGIENVDYTFTVRGCTFFNFATAVSGTMSASSDYNATDRATMGGSGGNANSLTSLTYADCIADTGATPANLDCRPKAGSPLLDTGNPITGITADILGTARPQGSAWDIGAVERVTASDLTPPVVASAAVDAAGTTLTIAFTEAGSPPVLPASGATGFALNPSGGAATLSAPAISNLTYTATISRAILQGETLTLDYTPGNVTDSAGPPNALAGFTGTSVTNNSTRVLPTLSNATIPAAGTTLTATLSEAGCTPASGTGGFTLAGTSATVASWAISGTTLTLTLSGTPYQGETVTYSYDRGTTTDDIADADGDFLANVSAAAVANNSTQVPPLVAGTATFVSAGPTTITVTATAPTAGTGSLSYQWEFRSSTDDGSTWSAYSDVVGATSLDLADATILTNETLYQYRCVQTKGVEVVTTNAVPTMGAIAYQGGPMSGGGTIFFAG